MQAKRILRRTQEPGLRNYLQTLAALVFARVGDWAQALAVTDALQKEAPADTQLNRYYIPSIRAAAETARGNGARAVGST
jgi:hypothetical protein